MRRKQYVRLVLAIGLLLFLSIAGFGQSDRGSIAGTVFDTSGAAVPGATVMLRGVATGNVYKTATTAEGVYRIADVAIGRYDVSVEVQGFKTSQQKGVLVQINTTTALNVTLQPGDVKEEVTVLADAPTLQTESSDIGTVVDKRQIEELPIALSATGQSFLRSPETFVFLAPGTTGPGTNADHSSSGIFESKLGGGQNFGTEVLLDGASVQRTDVVSAFDQTAPSVEALSEFKVTTANPSAQFGRTSGGVESFSTKSGTNTYHGTAFELFRNEALDANSWLFDFNNPPDTHPRKNRDRQNDFGGSLGGPIRIPHVYDGHDKLFFFFSWEQYRNQLGSSSLTTVPSQAERGGDFSAILGPGLTTGGANPQPIINPCTGQQVFQNQIFDPSTTQVTSGGQTCRLPFPGNKINTPLSTVAQNVLNYVPLPTSAGGPLGINNFVFNTRVPIITTTTSFRIDDNLTDKNKLFFSYSSRESTYLNGTNPSLPFPVDPGNYHNRYYVHYLRLGYDFMASPTLLNHLVIGFNRVWTASIGESVNGSDWDKVLGIAGASGQTFPSFNFGGGGVSFTGLGGGNDDRHIPNSLVVADSISWTKGRHSVRFGGEWRSYQFSVLSLANQSGSFNFSNTQTAWGLGAGEVSNGDPLASFMVGAVSNENLSVFTHFPRWIQNYYALYVEDNFKFRRNLTLNLGLRWDVDTPRHEAYGVMSDLSLTAINPVTNTPGAMVYGNQAIGAHTYYKDFGPRIGFAWSPDTLKNTVLRGAYSIYYAPLSYSDFGNAFTLGTTASPNFSSPDGFTPLSQPLDAGFMPYPAPTTARDPNLLNFSTSENDYIDPSYGRPGMVQNWNLEVQHQIAQDLILSIGYVGQHATRLRSNLAQINALSPAILAMPNPNFATLGPVLNYPVMSSQGQAVLAQLGVTVPAWFEAGWGPSGNDLVGQLLRPFPQFGNISTSGGLENLGQSTYHSLQAKLERRFRNGLNLLASYTFSKTLTDADSNYPAFSGFQSNNFGAQNPYNLRAEKAVSYQDIPHTFVLSYMYELPAGPGKRYLTHGVGSRVLGGWQIGGVHRYQSGSPNFINQYATAPNGLFSFTNFHYSLIPGQPFFVSNPAHWTPSLDKSLPSPLGGAPGWDSTCAESPTGSFSFDPGNNAQIVNCNAFLDPSLASLTAGGGFVFGNIPNALSFWRSPGYMNEDFAIVKRTTIRESHSIVFKLDIPNAFNRHIFGIGGGAPQPYQSHFGTGALGGGLNAPRQIQATLRYEF